MAGHTELTAVDYVIFSLTLAIPVAVGIYHAVRNSKQSGSAASATDSYLLAGRNMKTVPVSLSSFATTISTIAFVGYPAEAYTYGFQIAFSALGFILSIPVTVFIFLPVFYNQRITSVFEFLSNRFSSATRKLCSTLFVLLMTFYISVIIYGTTAVLTYVTTFDTWTAAAALCIVCTIYTTMGGMRAVIWTDFIQAFIMFATMFFIVGKGIYDVGGFETIWQKNSQSGRLDVLFTVDPFQRLTIWTVTFGIFFISLVHNNANQTVIQRYFSCPSLKVAQKTVIVSCLVSALVLFLFSFVGLVLYAAYENCDPYLNGDISSRNQLMPLFLVRLAGNVPGLVGLIVAGMCSAALSTLSSACNSLAAIILEDLLRPSLPRLSEKSALTISRILSAVYGISCLGFTVVASSFPNVLPAATQALNIIGAPTLAIFLMGVAIPRTNSMGAIIGFLAGLAMAMWISIGTMIVEPYIPTCPISISGCNSSTGFNTTGAEFPVVTPTFYLNSTIEPHVEPLTVYHLSYMLHGPFAFFVAIAVALVVSIFTEKCDPPKVDHTLVAPVLLRLYKISPKCIQWAVGYQKIQMPVDEVNNLMKNKHETVTTPSGEMEIQIYS